VRRKQEWFDDESLWRDLYPFMFPETRMAEAIKETPRLLRLTRPRGKAVLDLACGPGRFSVALSKRGYHVTGVDRTRFLLNKARARARAARARVEWIEKDMRDFVRPNAFDLAICMFTSFGFFEDKREDLRILDNLLASLKPGGVCAIDVMGKERLARIYDPCVIHALPDGRKLVNLHSIRDDWTRIRNEWILIRRGRAKTWTFDLTIYSGQELRDRMERAGFVDVNLHGSMSGEPYGLKSQRLIAVGRRGK
jgi:SAM-dependent methyltransferase